MNIAVKPQAPLLDLDLLKTLVAIAETGNFSAAAEVVFRTPSAVSMQIKKMEALLGRPVFTRDSRSVTLTEDGEALLIHARRVLAMNQQIIAQFIQPEIEGTVRLGATDHAAEQFLPAALRRFSQTHPGVAVDVTVDHTDYLIKNVETGLLDLTIVTRAPNAPPASNYEVLRIEPLVWAGLKNGVAAEQSPLPISVWEEGCVWRSAALAGLKNSDKEYRVTFKSAHIAAQKAAILADLAIAPLPASSCDSKVVALCAEYGLPSLPDFAIGLVMTSNPSPSINAVADHLRATLAN